MNQELDHTSDQVCYIFSFHYKLSLGDFIHIQASLQFPTTDRCLPVISPHRWLKGVSNALYVNQAHDSLPFSGLNHNPPNLICVKSGSLIQLGTFLGWKSKVRKGERSDACLIVRQGPAHQVCQFLILPDGGKRKEE